MKKQQPTIISNTCFPHAEEFYARKNARHKWWKENWDKFIFVPFCIAGGILAVVILFLAFTDLQQIYLDSNIGGKEKRNRELLSIINAEIDRRPPVVEYKEKIVWKTNGFPLIHTNEWIWFNNTIWPTNIIITNTIIKTFF